MVKKLERVEIEWLIGSAELLKFSFFNLQAAPSISLPELATYSGSQMNLSSSAERESA